MIPRVLLTCCLATTLAACGGARPLAAPATSPSAPVLSQPHVAVALAPHARTWERLLAAEDARGRTMEQLEALRAGLRADERLLRVVAVRGLGRLERPELAVDIAPMLQDTDPDVRAHAANALAQASRGGSVSRAQLMSALHTERNPTVRGVMAEALARMRHETVEDASRTIGLLRPLLAPQNSSEERLGAVRGLYFLVRQQGMRAAFDESVLTPLREIAASAQAAEETAVRLRVVAMATVTTAGGVQETMVRNGLQDRAWTVRREAVLAAATLQDTAAMRQLLASGLADAAFQVRLEALRGYGRRLAATNGCAPVRAAARDSNTHVRIVALELLGSCADGVTTDVALLDSVAADAFGGEWHEGARALHSLAMRAPDRAHAHFRASTAGAGQHRLPQDAFSRAHAARTLAVLRDTAGLRRLAGDSDVNVRTAAVQGIAPLLQHNGADIYLDALRSNDSQLLQAAAAALEGSAAPGAAAAALDALDRMTQARSETSRDARRALLRRAGELGSAQYATRVQQYVQDFDPVIAALAADVVAGWTGARPTPTASPAPALALPSFAEASALAAAAVHIDMMDGGRVELRLLPFEAPTNAARFARLAQAGYYDGLTLHRVVPNFVVQGGSPHANEYRGDGPFSRDELGLAGNWRGTVGLSTRGRDTGDAQLFINLIDNVRLDHDYTVFAEVVAGMDVVDRMQEGARMRRVTVVRP